MRREWDLGGPEWVLRGYRQNDWRWETSFVRVGARTPDVPPVPATVPGSVRGALVRAGLVASPYDGLRSRESEWIENRHWTFTRDLPTESLGLAGDSRLIVHAQSLDYSGVVLIDDTEVAEFEGALSPKSFDVTEAVRAGGRTLTFVFTRLPDELSQISWTSRIREWKARFNYGWDWTPRVVQVGVAGPVTLEAARGVSVSRVQVIPTFNASTGEGHLLVSVDANEQRRVVVAVDGIGHSSSHETTSDGKWHAFALGPVEPWTIHASEQPLYDVRITIDDADESNDYHRRVGFRSVRWLNNPGAPEGAEPWLLEFNGEPTFMAGINWVPIRPDYADVTEHDYQVRLEAYRTIGINLLRVWGGAARESDTFYRLADEMGFMVWQELPLSSSGLDNLPPDDEVFSVAFAGIATAYATGLAHHPSIVIWCGGNELAAPIDGGDPVPAEHDQQPFTAARDALAAADPTRRFIAASPSGPSAWARGENYGKGIHHDVHGPWEFDGTFEQWRQYWDADDALLRSEVGMAGASSHELLERHDLLGATDTAQAREELAQRWTHSASWWLAGFRAWDGAGSLEAWIEASQQRQAEFLGYAAAATARRFPECGGFIVWLGHDTFPCPVSLALLDFDGTPKPVAAAVAAAFTS